MEPGQAADPENNFKRNTKPPATPITTGLLSNPLFHNAPQPVICHQHPGISAAAAGPRGGLSAFFTNK